jgi:hypothetical protein
LSFDATACTELSRIHGTTISSFLNSKELQQTLEKNFNYLLSPIAFDVRIGMSNPDDEISRVYGGDDDARQSGSLMECRTMTASSLGAEGVNGSVLVIHLDLKDGTSNADLTLRSPITVSIDCTPFRSQEEEHKECEYVRHDEPSLITEKEFALSVYYETLRAILPPQDVRK